MLNLIELKKWRDHIATVPEHKVYIAVFRSNADESNKPECNSSACIIGHCASLYTLDELPIHPADGEILFHIVAERFLGIEGGDPLWEFLFDVAWSDSYNTHDVSEKEFALLRMDYVLKYGEQPEGWDYSMSYDDLKKWM